MRIVCQKCSAAYAIDDKLVTPKGIRAQCPRCRHLQLVKQGDAAPAVTEPAVPAPFSMPPAPPPARPAAKPASSAPAVDSDPFFDFAAPPTRSNSVPAPAPAAAPASFGSAGDMLDFSDLGGPPPPPPPAPASRAAAPAPAKSAPKPAPVPAAPAGLAPQSSAPFDFSGDFSFDEPAPAPQDQSAPGLRLKPKTAPPAGPGAMAAPQVKCKSCGKVLTDPFDQALGICDDCRSAQSSPGLGIPQPSKAPAPRTAAPPPSAAAPAPAGDSLETEQAEEKKRPPPPRPARTSATVYRDDPAEGGSGKVVAIAALALIVLGGGGAYLFIKKPWLKKPPMLVQKLPVSASRPIEAMVDRWKAKYPELSGSAAEHLAAGEEALALDTSSGYAEAESEFQKALVLDKNNDRAVAGWALALAFGKGDRIDAETQKMAEQMLAAAEQRGGDARVYAAHAHLLLVRNANLNDIRQNAERAIESPSQKDKALAYLALGQAYLGKNPESARQNIEEALKADSKLKRAYLYQVRMMTGQGDYRTAVLTLEKRLESEPDQFEAADLLGRLYLEVGEPSLAKKTYQKVSQAAPRAARPKLALAMFAYQHEGDLGSAAALLDALLAQKGSLDKQLQLDVLGHRAAVARLQGDYAAASQHADAALQLQADDLNAHLQKLFVSVALGNGAEARAQLSFLKLGDPALEATLEGRVLMAESRFGDAFEKLKKAVELDPRRTDALLLAAAAAVKAKQEAKGWEYVLARGYKADPMQSGPRPVMAPVFIARSDFIGVAKGLFSRLGKDKEDPNPWLADGVIAWHLGDLGAADEAFAKVIAADPTNTEGFSFRALIALKRHDTDKASKLAAKAVAAGRASGLAHCTLGWTQLMTNKVEVARKTLQKAVELAPNLYLARARLAEADIRVKKIAEAKAAMNTVLLSDPTYNEAKRVLYGIPQ